VSGVASWQLVVAALCFAPALAAGVYFLFVDPYRRMRRAPEQLDRHRAGDLASLEEQRERRHIGL
jgi:hypothetical protein